MLGFIFSTYLPTLDQLSGYRCYIYCSRLAAISQAAFYRPNYAGIPDSALYALVEPAKEPWRVLEPEVAVGGRALDVYAEVSKEGFERNGGGVKLIEINAWGVILGAGSLLFHWLDDKGILEPGVGLEEEGLGGKDERTFTRIVHPTKGEDEGGGLKKLNGDVSKIGRETILQDELRCLGVRGLSWILEEKEHEKFMRLKVEGNLAALVTRKNALERFRDTAHGEKQAEKNEVVEKQELKSHPKCVKLQKRYTDWRQAEKSG